MLWCSWAVIKGCDTKLQLKVPKVLKYEPQIIQPIVSHYTDYHLLIYWESESDICQKKLKDNENFTFSIPCITVQILQFQPTNANNCIRFTIIL